MTKTVEVLFHWKDRITDIVYLTDVADIESEITALDVPRADLQQILFQVRTDLSENADALRKEISELQKQIADIELREQALSEVLRAKSC